MDNADFNMREKTLKPSCSGGQGFHPVVNVIHLPPAVQLVLNGLGDKILIKRAHMGGDGQASFGRCFNDGEGF